MNAWRLTIQEVVSLSSKFDPDPFLSPREPDSRENSVFADTTGRALIKGELSEIGESNNG